MGGLCRRSRFLSLVLVVGGSFADATVAATIVPGFGPYQAIRPVRALVRHQGQTTEAPAVLYDGSGLNHDNPLLAQHVADVATVWQFPIASDAYPVSIEFDLGTGYLVNEMWLWQLPGGTFPGQGVREYDIVMRDADGAQMALLQGADGQPKSTGVQPVARFNAFGECVFLPVSDPVRFIELRIYENLGATDLVGLAEVSVFGRGEVPDVPEPSGWLMLMAAAAGLAFCRPLHRRDVQQRGRESSYERALRTTPL
jgi:hypothetical protein